MLSMLQLGPLQPLSHTHAFCLHSPASEQSLAEEHAAHAAVASDNANSRQRAREENAIVQGEERDNKKESGKCKWKRLVGLSEPHVFQSALTVHRSAVY